MPTQGAGVNQEQMVRMLMQQQQQQQQQRDGQQPQKVRVWAPPKPAAAILVYNMPDLASA